MRNAFFGAALALLHSASGQSVWADDTRLTAEQTEFFESKIRPVLVTHCYECHSAKQKAPRGGLRVDDKEALLKGGDSGPAVVPGDLKKSSLIGALKYDGLEMPPKGKLPEAVIADFETWVKNGAPDPRTAAATTVSQNTSTAAQDHWAFQKLKLAALPEVKQTKWAETELDRFVLAKLEAAGLPPARPADRRTLIRRAYLDLIGLPPTPEQVAAFEKNSASDTDAFRQVVEELLQSPHYGERWGRYWLDIARYGEDQAHTFKARNYPRGYLYRDWVVRSFNADLPYDRFLTEQIAGDLLDSQSTASGPLHERIAALGLFALGPVYYQDNGEKDKALADEWDDRIDTLIRGTQALTISCARCHDHKFDPLTMSDYYGLLGVFASTQYQERPAVAPEVIGAKQQADAVVKEHQLAADQFLATQARSVRERLIPEIPKYVLAAWQAKQVGPFGTKDKKNVREAAKKAKLNEELLGRWVAYLEEKPQSGAVSSARPYLESWRQLLKSQAGKSDLSKNEEAVAAVTAIGDTLRDRAAALLPHRTTLLREFGEEVAFTEESDRAVVVPGVIPLGNLFDDVKGALLSTALSSDVFKAQAKESSLGVVRVAHGWGHSTTIAPGVQFDFQTLGSDERQHGAVVNDAWDSQGGIRTLGKRSPGNLPRTEQGIGMHANALVTFDLEELRKAGLIPADKKLTLHVDRAGLNDDAFGAGSVHVAVIVSRPQSSPSAFDSVLSATVNGQRVKVDENDGAYYCAGELPQPLQGNGKFAEFHLSLPLDARYVTIVATGAGKLGEENSISSDHAVFSGARLEFDPSGITPATTPAQVAASGDNVPEISDPAEKQAAALLYSELFSDKGVLAIPASEVGQYLTGAPAEELKALNQRRDAAKKAADEIQVLMAHALTDGTAVNMPIYLAGDPRKKGNVVKRGFPALLSGGNALSFGDKGSGRLALARAITSLDNPLTARVFVNRVWAGHFGAGLVRTPSNFGVLGEKPSHPELLDWLASRFMASGWSIKSLHREIMLSATYRQASSVPPDTGGQIGNSVDPDNRWLWRMNRRRLEVEPWRDTVLSVTGLLDAQMGGPSGSLSNANNRRRTIYGFVSRHQLDELLRLFDFPDPNITAGQRTVTTVPLQQLFVLNSEFMIAQAKAFAARLQREGDSDAARIDRAYALLFQRRPTDEERQIGLEFLGLSKSGTTKLGPLEQYALALLGTNELAFVD